MRMTWLRKKGLVIKTSNPMQNNRVPVVQSAERTWTIRLLKQRALRLYFSLDKLSQWGENSEMF